MRSTVARRPAPGAGRPPRRVSDHHSRRRLISSHHLRRWSHRLDHVPGWCPSGPPQPRGQPYANLTRAACAPLPADRPAPHRLDHLSGSTQQPPAHRTRTRRPVSGDEKRVSKSRLADTTASALTRVSEASFRNRPKDTPAKTTSRLSRILLTTVADRNHPRRNSNGLLRADLIDRDTTRSAARAVASPARHSRRNPGWRYSAHFASSITHTPRVSIART